MVIENAAVKQGENRQDEAARRSGQLFQSGFHCAESVLEDHNLVERCRGYVLAAARMATGAASDRPEAA